MDELENTGTEVQVTESEAPQSLKALTVEDLDYYTSILAKKINDLNYVIWYLINNGVFHEPLPDDILEYVSNPENPNAANTREV